MNCEKSKNLITVSVYGKLTPSEKAQLEVHLRECSRCAGIFEKSEKLSSLFDEKEDIPLPDKEKSWQIISAKAAKRKGGWSIFYPNKKLAFAVSVLVVVLILGWAATQIFLPSSYEKDARTMEKTLVQAFITQGFMKEQSVQTELNPDLDYLFGFKWSVKRVIYSIHRENIPDKDIPQIFSQTLQNISIIKARNKEGPGERKSERKNEPRIENNFNKIFSQI